jgi:hypothetical protein
VNGKYNGFINKFGRKGLIFVIAITKEEKKIISEKYPRVHIVRTMKQDSKRGHYFMVEDPAPMKLLRSLRGENKRKGV